MPRWAKRLTEAERKQRKAERDRRRYLRLRHQQHTRRVEVRQRQLEETNTREDPMQRPAVELSMKGPAHGLRIAVIPDCQVKPGVPTDHLSWCGRYVADQEPDVVVCIGDFADMESLSTYGNAGDLEREGKRYVDDLSSAHKAMDRLMAPVAKMKRKPRLVFTLGNHEDRIIRAINRNPTQLGNLISLDDLRYEEYGWQVVPYLQPVLIGGVAFCHFFPSGPMGRPITTAASLLRKMHMSCFAGHLQGRDIAYAKRADGSNLTAIISGSFYQHNENYLSPFTNCHWRGMWMLNEVTDGRYDEMAVSINFLKRRYGK